MKKNMKRSLIGILGIFLIWNLLAGNGMARIQTDADGQRTARPQVRPYHTVQVYLRQPGVPVTLDDCKRVVASERRVPVSSDPDGVVALQQLFGGMTEDERARGYRSLFSPQTRLSTRSMASLMHSMRGWYSRMKTCGLTVSRWGRPCPVKFTEQVLIKTNVWM